MSTTDLASFRAIVYGRVQGVYFRVFTLRHAVELGLTGYVRNLPGGKAIEVKAAGEKSKLQRLIDYIKVGPPAAKVEEVVTNWSEYTGDYSDFSIRH